MLNCSPFLNAGEGGDAGGGGGADAPVPPRGRGAGRGRGRGGGRGRGEGGRGRGGGDVSSDIPSASVDEGSEETGPSTDVGAGPSTDLEAGPSALPKKPWIRGESQVPDEDKEPATEEAKILITPNGKE